MTHTHICAWTPRSIFGLRWKHPWHKKLYWERLQLFLKSAFSQRTSGAGAWFMMKNATTKALLTEARIKKHNVKSRVQPPLNCDVRYGKSVGTQHHVLRVFIVHFPSTEQTAAESRRADKFAKPWIGNWSFVGISVLPLMFSQGCGKFHRHVRFYFKLLSKGRVRYTQVTHVFDKKRKNCSRWIVLVFGAWDWLFIS